MLAYQPPAILFGSQPTTHHHQLFLGERNGLPFLARDVNEAWLGSGSYGAGKSNAVTHYYGPTVALIRGQIQFVKEKPRRGYTRGSSGPFAGTCNERGKFSSQFVA